MLVELMGVDTPRSTPYVRMCREPLGDQVYEWWISGEAVGPETMRWRTQRQDFRDGEQGRTVDDEYDWETFGGYRPAAESGPTFRPLPGGGHEATPEIGVPVK